MDLRSDILATALDREGLGAITGEALRGRLREAVFNGAVHGRPLALVDCVDEALVCAAVRAAAEARVPVSVLVGGHDLSARYLDESYLLLDLRSISQVSVDRAAGVVTVGGGALTRDLVAALPDDLVAVTGTISSVGVTGLTLAGGYGLLNSRFGLASDGLKQARVVLADGSAITASASENADLYWALRGGGSGFGVVTAMTLAVHTLPRVWTAMILVPLELAKASLLRMQDLIDRHPIELSLFSGFITAPTGQRMLFVSPLWSGASDARATLLQRLAPEGTQVLREGWGPFRDTFDAEGEKAWPKGRNYHIPTRTLRRLDGEAVDMLTEGARRMTSPHSAIVLHDFHGAATKIAPDATAFRLREPHYVVEIIASWDTDGPNGGVRDRHWADDLSARLSGIEIPGGYVNLLSPSDRERVRLFYGQAADKLIAVKRRFDPEDVFKGGTGRLTQ